MSITKTIEQAKKEMTAKELQQKIQQEKAERQKSVSEKINQLLKDENCRMICSRIETEGQPVKWLINIIAND